MNDTDLQLLQSYARNNSQDSFAKLIKRHLNLVFSAALRQVHSPQLAEEVAQSVFADLAQSAAKLKSGTILPAWLYEVTRRTAIDVVRRESRRQLREKVTHELTAMNATADDWTHIEPFLDEAMHALDEIDRAAVLLRYFENKSLREVGETLGTSDDAAQKRVSRAVERLREFFTKRGVTIGASGLVVIISTNAVQAAPIGLVATVSTAAILTGTAVHTSAVIAATKTIAMTTLQKSLITVTLAIVAGTGIYQARQASKFREQNKTLQQQQVALAEQIRELQRQRDNATNQLTGFTENAQLKPSINELVKLRSEVGLLRRQADDAKQELTTALSAKAQFQAHETKTISAMKELGFEMFIFADDNAGQFPTSLDQLTKELSTSLPGKMNFYASFDFINPGTVKRNQPQVVSLRERLARQAPDGTWKRIYGFADGRVVTAISNDGNFDAWEKVNTFLPPTNQNQ